MKEFATMADAVAEAAKTVDEWVILPSHEKISWDVAIERAQELDETYAQKGLASHYTYLCSAEGAIGLTEEKEYLAQWVLLPALPLPAELEERIRADYENAQQEENEGTPNGETPNAAAQTAGEQGAPAEQSVDNAQVATKYCRKCGKKIRADAEFCRYCGSALPY